MVRIISKNIRRYLLIVLVLLAQMLFAQTTTVTNFEGRFQHYRTSAFQEKLYVHTDRSSYLAGETIWFKIYNVDAALHHPMSISKVAYLEVMDRGKKPVLQSKVSMTDGVGAGSLTVPEDIASGNYIFRVYTNWMNNFDADFFYQKNISIVNTLSENITKEIAIDSSAIDVQFFPEGGQLVQGLKSKVGFRAINSSGKGIEFRGFILNQQNDTIINFSPTKFGIGHFDFTPQEGNSYKAIIQYEGLSINKELPVSAKKGYVLSLAEVGNEIEIRVQTTPDFENNALHLFVHTRNVIGYSQKGEIKNGHVTYRVDKKKLGEGISHITLFNSEMQPLCERLYFKHPEHKLSFNVNTDKQQYQSRQKIAMAIDAGDETGKKADADLSLAVYRIDSLILPEEDILSYLLLTSDLKGTVESPNYYFQNSTNATAAIDDLMLTHGWRRFKWEQVLKNDSVIHKYLPEFDGPIISGRVYNPETGLPVNNARAYLSIPAKSFHFYSDLSNDSGIVHFYSKKFYGLNDMVAQTNPGNNYRVDIQTPFSDRPSGLPVPSFTSLPLNLQHLKRRSVDMQVQNIYTSNQNFKQSNADSIVFYGKPQVTYLLDDYVRFPTMEEVLREYVSGVNVYRQNKNYSIGLMKKDERTGVVDRKNPLVLLDGVPMFDINKLMAYDPLKIKSLEIVSSDFFLGKLSFQGIVSFRTYTGRPEGIDTDPKATIIDYNGLQLQREFYSPVYDTENDRTSRLPDFRHLLYWDPQVKTSGKGQTIQFYSSDLAGRYLVVVQGLSTDGRAGSKTFTFDVVNPLFANAVK